MIPPKHHDNTVPLSLATMDDLVMELCSRSTSLIVGYIRTDVKGQPVSRIHRTGDQVACLGLSEIIRATILGHVLQASSPENMNLPPIDHSAGDPDDGTSPG